MRPVTAADFNTVYDIYMDETVNPFMRYEPMPKEDFKPAFDELTRRDHFWLFQHEGQDCAMCTIIRGNGRISHSARIASFGVKKEFQGQGLGKKIMKEIIAFLKNLGILRIDLTVEADNEKAIPLYKSLGFQTEGVMPKYFKRAGQSDYVDEISMSLIF